MPNDLKNAEQIVDALFVLLLEEGGRVCINSPNADFDGPDTSITVEHFAGFTSTGGVTITGTDVLDCLTKALELMRDKAPKDYTFADANLSATKKRHGLHWYFAENLGPWLERSGVPAEFAPFVSNHLNLAFRKGQQLGAYELREQLANSHGKGSDRATIAMLRERLAAADKLLLDVWVSMTRQAHEAGKTHREIMAEVAEFIGPDKTALPFKLKAEDGAEETDEERETAFD